MLECPGTGKRVKREGDVCFEMDRSQSSTPAGMMMLNTITPCAACKLLRRRCADECAFSPYFSPHEPQKFAAVHKVFGASNVSKLLMEVEETQRADAANSLVFEANLRIRDPVYGCMGAISALQQQIQILQRELITVRGEILKYKHRKATSCQIIASAPLVLASSVASSLHALAPPPPTPPLLPPSLVSSSSSSSSSFYNPAASSTVYSSSTNVSYLLD